MSELAQSVLEYIRRQQFLKAGDRAGVAVSGGADSVALLRVLLELRQEIGVVLSVVHFNHNLRGAESDEDERFVTKLAQSHGLEFHLERGDVKRYAGEMHLGTEAAARELRYQYFLRLMREERLNCIATGHTLDDQAETVLLKVVRGSGTRGLAGVYPKLVYPKSHAKNSDKQFSVAGSLFSVVRPLLGTQRAALEVYLTDAGQEWREDSSNRDLRYARNRVRHGIVPRLERTLNPRVKEALAETAEIARAEEEYWKSEVQRVLPDLWNENARKLMATSGVPLALARRVIRAAAESLGLRLEFRQVEEILGLGQSGSAMLPGWVVSRSKKGWQFEPERNAAPISDYAYALPVPGAVQVPEAGSRFEVTMVSGDVVTGYNPDHLFEPTLLQQELTVRNWRAGDRFWPAHTKSPKKVKELLQERKLAERERKLWPVVVSGNEIVWVRGFPAPARLRHRDGAEQALVIQEYAKS